MLNSAFMTQGISLLALLFAILEIQTAIKEAENLHDIWESQPAMLSHWDVSDYNKP